MPSSPDLPIAAVVACMTNTGMTVARSLGRKGIPVLGVDSDPASPGMYSRFCQNQVSPDPGTCPEDVIEALIETAGSYDHRPVLVPTSDEYLEIISDHRIELEKYYRFNIPRADLVRAFLDKRGTAELAKLHHIPHPRTFLIDTPEQYEQAVDEVQFPCILKPAHSHVWKKYFGGQKMIMVHSASEMKSQIPGLRKKLLHVIIQEIIPGPDDHLGTYFTYIDREGCPHGRFFKRTLRQYPAHFGISVFDISMEDETFSTVAVTFLKDIGYTGMIGIEFKLDPRDETWKLIEANIRFTGSAQLQIGCGLDLPWICYCDLAGRDMPERTAYRAGVKRVDFHLDIASFLQYRRMGEMTLFQWIRSYWGVGVFTYFAWDDLKPFLVVSLRLLKNSLKKVFRVFTRTRAYRGGG
jgi:D-aspartate ligase